MKFKKKLFIVCSLALLLFFLKSHFAHCENQHRIEVKLSLNRQCYKIGEPIEVECNISNMSDSTVWLPPVELVDVHFSLYSKNVKILPFEIPNIPSYLFKEFQYIELHPGTAHKLRRVLTEGMYKMPGAGKYRICVNYENNKRSARGHDLWVGKTDSCVALEIE
jgi:hypothetical protein